MTTFVLVHGAWHGSWCWQRVRKALQALGHTVFTPTLTGVGERSHLLAPGIDLNTHIDDVANLIRWEQLTDVVLCGHSYAGCVISGVADRMPGNIAALVYLDAFVLENGESLHDTLPSAQRELQIEQTLQHGEGWKVPPIPAEVFNVNTADLAWVNRQCTMQPLTTFQQGIRLQHAEPAVKHITYILATGWDESPFMKFHDRAQAMGWTTTCLNSGHDVMLDQPEQLTGILLRCASAPAPVPQANYFTAA
jgi:pimeloyl-ACP methyl ester carboxylesterase